MILGMSIPNFTVLHTILSVIAIVSGFIVLGGLYASRRLPRPAKSSAPLRSL
jgi:hypothetical protein